MANEHGSTGKIMKRKNDLYEKIYQYDNLYSAFYNASKGKRKSQEIHKYALDLEKNIANLQMQLMQKELDIGHYTFFKIHDPKPRDICAASFHERVMHHAIMNICEPILDGYAIDDSYACRKNKGTVKAIHRCQYFIRRYPWYLKMDIKKYFDSIDHAIALKRLAHKIKDKSLLLIIEQILDTYHISQGKGLPLGNLTSQHIANHYLGVFDHWIKETLRIKGYLRYMDDFVVFGDTKSELKKIHSQIQDYLWEHLQLILKHTTQLNRSRIGIPFLGFRIFKDKILLTPNSKKRFIKKFKQYERKLMRAPFFIFCKLLK
jgi:hypothetical protein